tara:strand:- start:1145 stop:1801 length:657 start_codon:yes stop_codon:yes gene_type:complete
MIVLPIKSEETEPWLLKKHYARRMCPISFAFGAYKNNILVGVVTYGVSASSTLRQGVCGKKWTDNVYELNRLCCANEKNFASEFVAKSMQMLPKPTIVVSYADTEQGHVGYVYQATNFLYTGLSTKFKDPKVKGLEHQHHATYAHGLTNAEVIEKYGEDNVYFVERARKHRYVFFVGSKIDKKKMRNDLTYEVLPYPKGDSTKYDVGGTVSTQELLFA